jgi:hypothetical protein
MERELGELDLQSVVLFEFLDTPGDEVAPGSNEIGKYFQDLGIGHDNLRFDFVQGFKVQSFNELPRLGRDSRGDGAVKSKGFLLG